MPIDKQLLRQLLATEKFKKCADSPDSAAELGSTLSDTESLVRSCQNVQAIPFILWNDFYNSAGILAPKSKKKSYRYKWGDRLIPPIRYSQLDLIPCSAAADLNRIRGQGRND